MPVNIFDIPKVVNLVVPESTGTNGVIMANYPMNRTDFTLLQGVSQTIQFFVRDIDRKPVALNGQTPTLIITDEAGENTLFSRQLTLVNPALGLFSVPFLPADLLTWDLGPKRYAVVVTDIYGYETMLWTDRNYTPFGTVTVLPGPIPAPAQPVALDLNAFFIADGWAYSSPLPASSAPSDAVATLSVSTTNFSGTIKIQGSLMPQPENDASVWFDVVSQNYVQNTGTSALTAVGVYTWLRVLYTIPEQQANSVPQFPQTSGSVDQLFIKI